VLEGWAHAEDVRVGLSVCQAGEAVEAVAANAAPGFGVGFVEVDPDGQVERPVPGPHQIVVQLLDPRLVRDGGEGEWARAWRLGRVFAGLAVDEVESLGLGVVRLEIGVGNWPGGGDAAVVLDLLEVAFTKAQQDAGVDLGVAADEVLGVRAKRDAVLVIPALGCHIPLAAEDLFRLPVLELPREVAAALEQEDLLAGRREAVRERAAARAAADDDHVVVLHRSP
jgi:hypothetical protein